ncbi:MAG: SMP-30/gluconolactonase/LRE family protein [Steroidobacteraceae bacterium]
MPSTPYYVALDRRFSDYIIPVCTLEPLYRGTRWAEGPVYFADGRYLIFSDIPNNRMLKWEEESNAVTVFRVPSNYANGNTRDRQGRLVSCEHGGRRVTRTEPDGRVSVIVDQFEGKRLNSPNDVIVKSDGTIWFTDPPYGILSDYEGNKGVSELGGCNVFRFDPSTENLSVVAGDFDKPNGLAFSIDERTLYIADSGRSHGEGLPHHVRALSVGEKGSLFDNRVFATIEPGIPDGIRVDSWDNVWIAAGDGVQCFASDGVLLGKILVDEPVSNLCFGGARRNRLFITAASSLYAVYLNTAGVQRP